MFFSLCFIVSKPASCPSSTGSSMLLMLCFAAFVLTKTSLWPSSESVSSDTASAWSFELLFREDSSLRPIPPTLALESLDAAILTSEKLEAFACESRPKGYVLIDYLPLRRIPI